MSLAKMVNMAWLMPSREAAASITITPRMMGRETIYEKPSVVSLSRLRCLKLLLTVTRTIKMAQTTMR